jgi:hypothetical protein
MPQLAVKAASAVVAGHRNPYRRDEEVLRYQRDLLAPFGVEPAEDLLRQGPNISFVELAEHALLGMPSPVAVPDMLIVSYGLPDCQPLKTVSSYLDHLLGGACRSFAISDQGLAAPFTALRIAGAYAKAGRCRSLALFVLEQTTFPYPVPLVHETPLVDSGVVLLLEPDGTFGAVATRRTAGGLGPALTGLAGLAAESGCRDVLVVAGPWADPAQLAACPLPCHQVAAGSYCTSIWLELARNHQDWAARHDGLLLCDTDPRTGLSHVVLLRNQHAPDDHDREGQPRS